jgi:hypothetical protein
MGIVKLAVYAVAMGAAIGGAAAMGKKMAPSVLKCAAVVVVFSTLAQGLEILKKAL